MRLFLGAAARHDDFIIANRVRAHTWHHHQAITVRAKLRHRFFPDGKVAGGVVVASIENAFLLPRFAFYQVATAIRTERARLRHD